MLRFVEEKYLGCLPHTTTVYEHDTYFPRTKVMGNRMQASCWINPVQLSAGVAVIGNVRNLQGGAQQLGYSSSLSISIMGACTFLAH